MTTVCLKLVTGEEIICKDLGNDQYEDLASIIMVPSQAGGQKVGLGLAPFMPYVEETKFNIDSSKVICKGTPTTEMFNNYSRIYGSGIQLAGASIQ